LFTFPNIISRGAELCAFSADAELLLRATDQPILAHRYRFYSQLLFPLNYKLNLFLSERKKKKMFVYVLKSAFGLFTENEHHKKK
jgi:hypothetical protein